MDVGAREGHEFDFSAMFDRVDHPALGRHGGQPGGATRIVRSNDDTMTAKGKQFVPHGVNVEMAFPGGAGYGQPGARDSDSVKRDVALGYITSQHAIEHYGLSAAEITDILEKTKLGEI